MDGRDIQGHPPTPKRAMSHRREGRPRRRSRPSPRAKTALGISYENTDATEIFACPLYRRYPLEHMNCVSYKLKRMSDVRQHIQRRHVKHPGIDCPICHETFDTSSERDDHVNSSLCPLSPLPPRIASPGIQQSVLDRMRTRTTRGMSHSEVYLDLWDTLFEDQQRPLNLKPHLEPILLETATVLRDLWQSEKSSIIQSVVNDHTPWGVVDPGLSGMLMNAFDQLQTRFEQRVRIVCSTGAANSPAPTTPLSSQGGIVEDEEASIEQSDFSNDLRINAEAESFGTQFPAPQAWSNPDPPYEDLAPPTNANTFRYTISSQDDGTDFLPSGQASHSNLREFIPGHISPYSPDYDFSGDLASPFKFQMP